MQDNTVVTVRDSASIMVTRSGRPNCPNHPTGLTCACISIGQLRVRQQPHLQENFRVFRIFHG